MKKNGFTLAEVLITLAIIGVVASLTLPSLLVNTGEQQYITAYKKAINTLSEAGQLNMSLSGFDYSSLTQSTTNVETDANGNVDQSLWALLKARTNVVRTDTALQRLEGNTTIYFKDGTAISYVPANTVNAGGSTVNGFTVVLDVNGNKGPNLFSNCTGQGAQQTAIETGTVADPGQTAEAVSNTLPTDALIDGCNVKATRMIKDRFTILLRGGHAEAFDAAGLWITQKS